MLEVGLTVEVLRLDIGDALGQRAPDHDHIAREELVLFDFDDTADLNVKALNLIKG